MTPDHDIGKKMRYIPEWTVGVGKFAATVVCAVAIVYARFVGTETKVDENRRLIMEMKGVDSAQTELINAMDRRFYGSEMGQKIENNNTKDALGRIESMVKEVRADVRELQQRVK